MVLREGKAGNHNGQTQGTHPRHKKSNRQAPAPTPAPAPAPAPAPTSLPAPAPAPVSAQHHSGKIKRQGKTADITNFIGPVDSKIEKVEIEKVEIEKVA
jgi:hypothetical protein